MAAYLVDHLPYGGSSWLSQFKTCCVMASSGVDVEIYAFHCGILKNQTQYILKDTRVGGPFDIPVPFYLIRAVIGLLLIPEITPK